VDIQLDVSNLKKSFNRRVVFEKISFSLRQHHTMIITGRNGSGKSTLAKILSDVLRPDEGVVEITYRGRKAHTPRRSLVGLVSPYLQMYDEFTACENLQLCLAMRGLGPDHRRVDEILEKVALSVRKNDPVRTYSSGMKQRMKYAFALAHEPPLLILDEPMANLDAEGIAMVHEIMQDHIREGIAIVCTNNRNEIPAYDLQVDLNAST
jgi:heme exporter protein A